jgi:hypothetical protein
MGREKWEILKPRANELVEIRKALKRRAERGFGRKRASVVFLRKYILRREEKREQYSCLKNESGTRKGKTRKTKNLQMGKRKIKPRFAGYLNTSRPDFSRWVEFWPSRWYWNDGGTTE